MLTIWDSGSTSCACTLSFNPGKDNLPQFPYSALMCKGVSVLLHIKFPYSDRLTSCPGMNDNRLICQSSRNRKSALTLRVVSLSLDFISQTSGNRKLALTLRAVSLQKDNSMFYFSWFYLFILEKIQNIVSFRSFFLFRSLFEFIFSHHFFSICVQLSWFHPVLQW